MLTRIYFQKGKTLFPGDVNIEDIFLKNIEIDKKLVDEWDLESTTVYGSFLEDSTLKDIGAERMVRKTTERQSRWLISAGVKTWDRYYSSKTNNTRAGLYLGLGTIDCDNSDENEYIDSCSVQSLSEYKLCNSKPLLGLILLNSTAASHISQMTGITGINCCFGPLVDAGSNALIEAAYDLQEGKVQLALCGGGGQKITPWYFLAYEKYWKNYNDLWLTESASFFTMTQDAHASEIELHKFYRGRLSEKNNYLANVISRAKNEADTYENFTIEQALFIGCLIHQPLISEIMVDINLDIAQCFIEEKVGYTGAAGVALAVNLALILLEENISIHKDMKKTTMKTSKKRLILLVILGAEKQVSYLLIGDENIL